MQSESCSFVSLFLAAALPVGSLRCDAMSRGSEWRDLVLGIEQTLLSSSSSSSSSAGCYKHKRKKKKKKKKKKKEKDDLNIDVSLDSLSWRMIPPCLPQGAVSTTTTTLNTCIAVDS